jgi:prophage tail gpP-like protein
MKSLRIALCMLLAGFLNSGLIAGQVYTWTDKDGNLHVTDTPPPPKAEIKDTLEYQEKTFADIQEMQRRQEDRAKQKSEEAVRRQADKAAGQAAQADKDAQAAAQQAEEQYQKALRTYEIYGKTPEKRKKFKTRIRRAFDQAESAQQRASAAAENARQAQAEARSALENANALEEKSQ